MSPSHPPTCKLRHEATGSREETAARSTARLSGQLYGHLGLRHLFLGFLSSRLPAPEREGPWPQASWLSLNPDRTVNTGKQEEVFGRADDK